MLRNHRITSWLLLGLLGCLFILSVAAPRAWRDVARETSIDDLLAEAAVSPQGDGTIAVPIAPTLDFSADAKGAWTMAKPSSALAANPELPEAAVYKIKPGPNVFNMVDVGADAAPAVSELVEVDSLRGLDEDLTPLVALIPDPSRPNTVLPLDLLPDNQIPSRPLGHAGRPEDRVSEPVESLWSRPRSIPRKICPSRVGRFRLLCL